MDLSRLEDLRRASDQLFEKINQRIRMMESNVINLRNRINEIQLMLVKITSNKNKSTCFYSPSCYPMDSSMEIKFEPVRFEPQLIDPLHDVSSRLATNTFNKPLKKQIIEDIDQMGKGTKNLLNQIEDLVKSLAKTGPTTTATASYSSYDLARSVGASLVYLTYEGLKPPANGRQSLIRQIRSAIGPSEQSSSIHEFGSRSYRSHPTNANTTALDRNHNKSSSGENLEAIDLGPAPDSILRYHQESLIEPDMLDTFDLLYYQDDESGADLITDDLPEILPTLSGVVKDVKQVPSFNKSIRGGSNRKSTSPSDSPEAPPDTFQTTMSPPTTNHVTNPFLSQFEPLFRPIDELPLPETINEERAEQESFASSDAEEPEQHDLDNNVHSLENDR